MGKKKSIKISVAVPLMIVAVFFSVLTSIIAYRYATKALNEDAKNRAEVLAYAVQHIAEVSGPSSELHRIVQVLGTENNVHLIRVFFKNSGKIIASNIHSDWNSNVYEGNAESYDEYKFLKLKASQTIDAYENTPGNHIFVYASPFFILEEGQSDLSRAIVVVELDIRSLLAKLSEQILTISVISFIGIAVMFGVVWLLLNLYLYRPIRNLVDAIEARKSGNQFIVTDDLREDELGILAKAFRDLITLEESFRQSLVRSQQELQIIFDNVPVRIWYKDDKNKIIRLNKSAADSMSLCVEDAEGKNTDELFPAMAQKYLIDDLEVIESGKSKLNIIEEYTPLDGDRGWVKTDKVPYYFIENQQRGVLVVSQDITELKKIELKHIESEQRFSLAAEATQDGIWDWPNMEEDGQYWSSQWKSLVGFGEFEIEASASGFFRMIHPDDINLTKTTIEKHAKSGTPFNIENRLRTKSGAYRWFQVRGKVINTPNEGQKRATGSITDIQTRKDTDKRLMHYMKELERSNKDLDEFAYVASHDLKAPLRGVDQLASWIEEDIAEKKYDELDQNLTLMRSRVTRMEKLLADLLAYSRIGRTEITIIQIDTSDRSREIFDLTAAPKSFQLVIGSGMPVFNTYASAFDQVLRNLINNAVKHRAKDNGTIWIDCDSSHSDYYSFSVKDNGEGISEEHHKLIFKMFKSLKPRDEVEGSGMGLALVKKIVNFYGGDVLVASSIGKGAQFTFTWPKHISRSPKVKLYE